MSVAKVIVQHKVTHSNIIAHILCFPGYECGESEASKAKVNTVQICLRLVFRQGVHYPHALCLRRQAWSMLVSIFESFPEKPSWCRNEQVCQGVKCEALCAVRRTGYCAI